MLQLFLMHHNLNWGWLIILVAEFVCKNQYIHSFIQPHLRVDKHRGNFTLHQLQFFFSDWMGQHDRMFDRSNPSKLLNHHALPCVSLLELLVDMM